MVCLGGAGAPPAANSAGAHVRLGEKDGEAQRLPAGMWRLSAPSRRSRSVRGCRNPLSIGPFGPTCRLRSSPLPANRDACRAGTTLRFRGLLTAEMSQHRPFAPCPFGLSFRPLSALAVRVLSAFFGHEAQGGIVRAAATRRAGSDSSALRSAIADSASASAETATLADANVPDRPSW